MNEIRDEAPPQNLEAEESVLGAMMVSEMAVDPVIADIRLGAQDFYRERHRTIYSAIKQLVDKGEPVDAISVSELLTQRGELADVGGREVISGLASTVPAAGNAKHYAQIVKQNALLRRLLRASHEIEQSVRQHEGEPRELVERAEARLFEVANQELAGDFRSAREVLTEELKRLEQLQRGDIEVTGTRSGFSDLDNITGGFQPGNLVIIAARPAMGKCLSGDALIHDPRTGARRPMREVVEAVEAGEEVWVSSVTPDLKLRASKVAAARRSGVQQLFRLETKLGRRIEATANHPLMTLAGWRELGELSPGDRIAVPRHLPAPAETRQMPDHHLVMLAALIADGNLTGRTPRYCFGRGSGVVHEVRAAALAFGTNIARNGFRNGTSTISAGRGRPNPVRKLCERHGLWGLGSQHKFVPDEVFGQSDLGIRRFLSILFACDGHVHVTDRLAQVGYSTISERLARDVQHLLLRLGIVSTIRRLKRQVYEGTDKQAYEVRVTDQLSLLRFGRSIVPPGKEAQVERLLDRLATVPRSTNTDTVPLEIWKRILDAKGSRSWADVSVATGRPRNHNWHVGTRNLSREVLAELAVATRSPELATVSEAHIWWDEVLSVEAVGRAETFDLDVPPDACFVADDIVVHNSALVCNIAENVAVREQKPVAFFSLEMSEAELAHRFIASQARVSNDKLRKGKVGSRDWQKVVRASATLEESPLWLDDSSDLSMLELRAKARRLAASEGGLGLVIVDYMQLMRAEDPRVNRVEQVGQISRGLKILARELETPVLGLSQLSRAPEQRTGDQQGRPMLSDLRESGSIEQDADVVLFIYRPGVYHEDAEPNEAELLIAKHRNGPVGEVPLVFLDQYPKFADRSWRDEPAGAASGSGGGQDAGALAAASDEG